MHNNRLVFLLGVAVFTMVGCGQRGAEMTGKGNDQWTDVDKFEGVGSEEPGHYYAVAIAAENGNWRDAQKVAASPEFEKHLEAFASSPVPSEWSMVAPEKDKVVTECKTLIETARKGSPKDFQTAYTEFAKTFRAMRMKKLGIEKSAPPPVKK